MEKVNTESNEELFYLYKKTKSKDVRDKIILKNASLVKIIARQMLIKLGNALEVEDLESYGIIGLIDAIDKFDVDKDVKFETYASLRIRGSILDEVRKQDWVPRSIRATDRQINDFETNFRNMNGREATSEEVAAALGMSEVAVNNHKALMIRSRVDSLDGMMTNDDDDSAYYDKVISNSFRSPEDEFMVGEVAEILKKAMECLTDKEKTTILLIYYEDLTSKEVSKVLDVSESRVSQLHTHALEKIKNALGKEEGMTLMHLFSM